MKTSIFFCSALIGTLLSNQTMSAEEPILRDPTKPALNTFVTDTKAAPPQFVLQSIIISPTRQLALINSKFVAVGDHIGNATVKTIKKNYVVLSEPGQTITIYLFTKPHLE